MVIPKSEGKPGRPPLSDEVVALIKRMASENHTWGAKRIRGELKKLGIEVAKSTIQRYLRDIRGPLASKQSWATFLRNHASQIWACDFLQTYDLFFRPLFVFVIVALGSRQIVHFAVTRSPTDAWVAQQLRNAIPCSHCTSYNRLWDFSGRWAGGPAHLVYHRLFIPTNGVSSVAVPACAAAQ